MRWLYHHAKDAALQPPGFRSPLVVYAVSHPQLRESAILYPTTDPAAREAKINVADPVVGRPIGRVCLRPVNLSRIEELVADTSSQGMRNRRQEASRMAFGSGTSG